MATSDVQICNMALTRLGEEPITSLSDDSAAGRACNRTYSLVVDEMLEMHLWECAKHPVSLAASATVPVYKWQYQYDFPTSPYLLRLLEVKDINENDLPYQLMGRKIFCNVGDGLYITYVKRIVTPSEFSPLLASAIALRLAHWIEPMFGDSITRRKSILEEWAGILLKAKQSGAMQDYTDDKRENDGYSGNAEWIEYGR